MLKKLWIKCIKNFIIVSIPTIVAIITLLTIFNKGIETALQKIGIMGCILVFCLCFILTFIIEVNETIKSMEISEKIFADNKDLNRKIINNYK